MNQRRESDQQIPLLIQEIRHLKESTLKVQEDQQKMLDKIANEIYGDHGIKVTMAVHSESENNRKVRERVALTAVFGLIMKAIYDLFSAKHGGG